MIPQEVRNEWPMTVKFGRLRKYFKNSAYKGTCWAVQWLRFCASAAGTQVQSLGQELRACLPCSKEKNATHNSTHAPLVAQVVRIHLQCSRPRLNP